jgi:pimeloyl-ACP methyl ester carboxylesterase
MSWLERTRLDEKAALRSRPGTTLLETSGGRVRLRRAPSAKGPRVLFAADGPNVVEHYDALLSTLAGRADVTLFEPPGTGGSVPDAAFDFSLEALARVSRTVVEHVRPHVVVFPCYLGFVGRALDVERLVTPQTPSWSDLATWCDGVDPRRLLRTPVLGQLFMRVRRKAVARQWFGASTGDRRFRQPFAAAAEEAFAFGGCFCLSSLMQGLERGTPLAQAQARHVAVVHGARDRTHRRSTFAAPAGGTLVTFEECGHSPELEAPARFASWLLDWARGAPA